MPPQRTKPTSDASASKEDWTAIGVTVETKERLSTMKQGFEQLLKQGPKTWDYFLKALLDLGPLTWKFLIDQIVKDIETSTQACPLPNQQSPPPRTKEGTKPAG